MSLFEIVRTGVAWACFYAIVRAAVRYVDGVRK